MARILVVDDQDDVREAIQMVLEHAGHHVSVAKDGEDAVKAFRKAPADLVLCDLLMPGRDGLEAIQDLRREFPGVKIIAMTGAGMRGGANILAAARLLGAVEVMSKPFERADLLAVIDRHLAPDADGGKQP